MRFPILLSLLLLDLPEAQILISPADTAGNVGLYTAIAIGSDGLPMIGYMDGEKYDLKFLKCGNAACSNGNAIRTLDTSGAVGERVTLKVAADGRPLLAYFTLGDRFHLKVLKCGNATCSEGNTVTTVDTDGNMMDFASIEFGADALPILAYYDDKSRRMKVARCGNAACSEGNTITSIDSHRSTFGGSIAVGTDGLPMLAYIATEEWPSLSRASSGELVVARCKDAACTSRHPPRAASAGSDWYRVSLKVGKSGMPLLVADEQVGFDKNVWAIACGAADCASGVFAAHRLAQAAESGVNSVAFGTDGFPIVALFDYDGWNLKVVKCGDISCSANNLVSTVDGERLTGGGNAIAVAADGLPVIGYFNNTRFDLMVAKCMNAACSPTPVAVRPSRTGDARLFPGSTGARAYDAAGRSAPEHKATRLYPLLPP